MKKLLAIALAMLMAVSTTACSNGSEQTNDNGNSNSQSVENNNNTPAVSNEISVENLMNYPTSPEEDFDCIIHEDDWVELVDYLGDDEIVVIPETYKGKKITNIGAYAFREPAVKAVKICDSVKTLDEGSFCYSETLELVICGSGLKTIEENTFMASGKIKQIVLNDGLEKIGSLAFAYCESLESLEIPDSVTEIDEDMTYFAINDDVVIIASEDSVSAKFAKENNMNFQAK